MGSCYSRMCALHEGYASCVHPKRCAGVPWGIYRTKMKPKARGIDLSGSQWPILAKKRRKKSNNKVIKMLCSAISGNSQMFFSDTSDTHVLLLSSTFWLEPLNPVLKTTWAKIWWFENGIMLLKNVCITWRICILRAPQKMCRGPMGHLSHENEAQGPRNRSIRVPVPDSRKKASKKVE